MLNKRLLLSTVLLATVLVLIAGCAHKRPQALYNYEGYSQTYYHYKQDGTPESLTALQEEVVKAIENSQNSVSKRVAPGLYANLGYIQMRQGKTSMAIENFKMEMELYPESRKFMQSIIASMQTSEDKVDK